MLEEGARLAAELGLVNVAFSLVDLYALPARRTTPSASFVCRNAFHLLPEPVAALAELLRVTSAGGRIVVVDPVVDEVTDKAFNDLAGCASRRIGATTGSRRWRTLPDGPACG